MTQPCFTTVSMVNSSDSEEGSDSKRMMNENLPPEGLIECDDGETHWCRARSVTNSMVDYMHVVSLECMSIM